MKHNAIYKSCFFCIFRHLYSLSCCYSCWFITHYMFSKLKSPVCKFRMCFMRCHNNNCIIIFRIFVQFINTVINKWFYSIFIHQAFRPFFRFTVSCNNSGKLHTFYLTHCNKLSILFAHRTRTNKCHPYLFHTKLHF